MPVLSEELTMDVMTGANSGKRSDLIRLVGRGSSSDVALELFLMILTTSSSDVRWKEVKGVP